MDTKLFVRKQPGGFFAAYDREEFPAGTVWWVRSTTGVNDTGSGRNPDAPLATLAYAITQASAGDTIFLMPDHAESQDEDAVFATVSKAGLRIFGLGDGTKRPTFTAKHANARILVSAANVTIRNVRLVADTDDVVQAILTTNAADDLLIEKCSFESPASDDKFLLCISLVAATNRVTVKECVFFGIAAAEQVAAIKTAGTCDQLRVIGCVSLGQWTEAVINLAAASGVTLALIANNTLHNANTGTGIVLNAHASTTGLVVHNVFAGSKNNTVPLTAGNGLHYSETYMTDNANETAIVKPDVTTFS